MPSKLAWDWWTNLVRCIGRWLYDVRYEVDSETLPISFFILAHYLHVISWSSLLVFYGEGFVVFVIVSIVRQILIRDRVVHVRVLLTIIVYLDRRSLR